MASDQPLNDGLSRRQLLQRGFAGGLLFTGAGWIAACGGDDEAAAPQGGGGADTAAATTATTGGAARPSGSIKVAVTGGSGTNTVLDPNVPPADAHLGIARVLNVWSRVAEYDAEGNVVPFLAEAIEPNADATEWTITLKQGITWHDGSELTADDIVYSYRRMLDPDNTDMATAASNIDMIDAAGLERVDQYTVRVPLNKPWSDLPAQLAQRYVSIVKDGTTTFTEDNLNGTGPYKFVSWEPGTRLMLTAHTEYFEEGKPTIEQVEVIGISDPQARLNALLAGQVDAADEIDKAQHTVLDSTDGVKPLVSTGGAWEPIVMNTQQGVFADVRVRQALRLAADREQMVEVAMQGFGEVAKDLFSPLDPLYHSELPQREYDPEQARSLLREAGQEGLKLTLQSSDAVPVMLSSALVYAQTAKEAGIEIEVRKNPADSFWDDVYGKVPFTHSAWSYRPMLAQWVQAFVSFNKEETNWGNQQAIDLMFEAAGTVDPDQRRQLAWDAQEAAYEDGGYIIWGFSQFIDGLRENVNAPTSPILGLAYLQFKEFTLS